MSQKTIMFALASPGGVAPEAMAKALRLASMLDAELELFHCVFDPEVMHPGRAFSRGVTQDILQLVEHRRWQLQNNARRLHKMDVGVRVSVRWDHPVHEGIVRQVLRHRPDLLIVQSSGRLRAARAMARQTDIKLIEACPCPLLIIKSLRPYSGSCTVAAVDPLRSHGKPLSLDDAVLSTASTIAQALSEDLHVYHACKPWEQVTHDTPQLRHIPEIEQADARAAYQQTSEAPVRELALRHNVPLPRVRVSEGNIAELLPAFAKSVAADVVVIGAVERPFLKRVFIGHTAERLLDRVSCDVLVVKSPEFRSPVSRQSAHLVEKNQALRARYIW